MNDSQEIREKEISLTDLMFYCLERWRCILVCMIIAGIAAGAYKYTATVQSNQIILQNDESSDSKASSSSNVPASVSDITDEEDNADDSEDLDVSDVYGQSVESYKNAIRESQRNIEIQKEYLDNSAVMQIDPYHVATGTLSYYINGGEHLDSILASYRAFITDGRMAEALHAENKDISTEDLRYLVTFNNSEREAYRLEDNQVIRPEEIIFQIQIRMPDSKLCSSYLKAAEQIVKDYSAQLKKDVAKHDFKMLASSQSEQTDTDLQSYQTAIRAAYVESIRGLQTLQTELDTASGLSEEGAGTTSSGEQAVTANPLISAVKYAVIGIVLGAFLACFGLSVLYIMSGKLQNTRGFSGEFGIPMLGIVRDGNAKKRWFGWLDAWIFRLEEGAYARLGFDEQVKLAAANVRTAAGKIGSVSQEEKDTQLNQADPDKDLKKIMLAGTLPEKEIASLYTELKAQMKGIALSEYTQIVFQADALNGLADYDGILFLEKRRVSEARFIMKEKSLALDRGVKILGTIVSA